MDNNVVLAICRALPEIGVETLRFNFRGAGNSEGAFAKGIGEVDDLKAALAYSSTDFDGPVFIVGYSFGAFVAAQAVNQGAQIRGLALVSPPLDFPDLAFSLDTQAPVLALCGDRDIYCSLSSLNGLGLEKDQKVIVPGADHFWMGFESSLPHALVPFIQTLMEHG
jgi:hypothetical protein